VCAHIRTYTHALRLRCCCYDYILSAVNVLSDTVKSKRILMFSYLLLSLFFVSHILAPLKVVGNFGYGSV